jgi:hypothetical protein
VHCLDRLQSPRSSRLDPATNGNSSATVGALAHRPLPECATTGAWEEGCHPASPNRESRRDGSRTLVTVSDLNQSVAKTTRSPTQIRLGQGLHHAMPPREVLASPAATFQGRRPGIQTEHCRCNRPVPPPPTGRAAGHRDQVCHDLASPPTGRRHQSFHEAQQLRRLRPAPRHHLVPLPEANSRAAANADRGVNAPAPWMTRLTRSGARGKRAPAAAVSRPGLRPATSSSGGGGKEEDGGARRQGLGFPREPP